MARIDDFKQAKELSKKELLQYDPEIITRYAGVEIKKTENEIESLVLKFLNRDINVTWPDMDFTYVTGDGEISIQQQAFILHYLKGYIRVESFPVYPNLLSKVSCLTRSIRL